MFIKSPRPTFITTAPFGKHASPTNQHTSSKTRLGTHRVPPDRSSRLYGSSKEQNRPTLLTSPETP